MCRHRDINDVARERRGITRDTALRLARYFGTPPRFWLNLQSFFDLRKADVELGKKSLWKSGHFKLHDCQQGITVFAEVALGMAKPGRCSGKSPQQQGLSSFGRHRCAKLERIPLMRKRRCKGMSCRFRMRCKMCELFGMSARSEVLLRETLLSKFPPRGGQAADNPDGWGVAWRDMKRSGAAMKLVKEPEPGCQSREFERLIQTQKTDLVIGHVRKARFPRINNLGNTHPFLRTCCDRTWAFAHNGLVPEIIDAERVNPDRFCAPQGETDSEFAFCHLLGTLNGHHEVDWIDELRRVSAAIALNGKFNFLLSDGVHLIAYGHDRLHYLESADGRAAVVATEPLTDDPGWTAFAAGELRIYRAGQQVSDIGDVAHVAGAARDPGGR